MSYKVKAEDWEVITPLAEKLAQLRGYESLVLTDSRESIDRLRHLLYSWLYESGLKRSFKLVRRGPEKLEIVKKGDLAPEVSIVDRVNEFVRDKLIELEAEGDVMSAIREAVSGNILSLEEGTRALTEWQRAQGKVPEMG